MPEMFTWEPRSLALGNNLDGFGPDFLFRLFLVDPHQSDVIGVAERDIALPGIDRLGLRPVITRRLDGEIVLDAAQPVLRPFLAMMGDHGRE